MEKDDITFFPAPVRIYQHFNQLIALRILLLLLLLLLLLFQLNLMKPQAHSPDEVE